MIVDSHHHLWDPGLREYPWLDDPLLAPIRRRFTIADLQAAASARLPGMALPLCPTTIHTVLVQTIADRTETLEFLATAAASDGLVLGVVGWVDLTAPDVADQLAELRAAPGGELLVGIRHLVQDEPDPTWLARPDVLRGLRAVRDEGLVFDLLVRAAQIDAAWHVASMVPDLQFVLDHLAKPPISTGHWQPWAWRIRALSQLPNVVAKLSGLVTEDRWDDWHTEHILPYATLALDIFGPERLMFGSDWPVCTLAASYPETFALAEQVTDELTRTERAAFFCETACRVYDLKGVTE